LEDVIVILFIIQRLRVTNNTCANKVQWFKGQTRRKKKKSKYGQNQSTSFQKQIKSPCLFSIFDKELNGRLRKRGEGIGIYWNPPTWEQKLAKDLLIANLTQLTPPPLSISFEIWSGLNRMPNIHGISSSSCVETQSLKREGGGGRKSFYHHHAQLLCDNKMATKALVRPPTLFNGWAPKEEEGKK
jgi:hypothetical protein